MSFIPDPSVIAAFTIAALVLIITPGPDMTLFMSKTLTLGQKAGVAAVLGASSGLVAHSLLAAVGLSALLAASEIAFYVIKIFGAAYLLWLAVQAIRHGSALTLDPRKNQRESFMRVWASGFGINLLNPKIVLFFITFLPQFISVNDPDASAKLLFLGFYFVLLALPCCLAMVVFAGAISRFLRQSPKVMRVFDWIFASIMAGFALKLLNARAPSI